MLFQQRFCFFEILGKAQNKSTATTSTQFQVVSTTLNTLTPYLLKLIGNHRTEIVQQQLRQTLQMAKQLGYIAFQKRLYTIIVLFLQLRFHHVPESIVFQPIQENRYHVLRLSG